MLKKLEKFSINVKYLIAIKYFIYNIYINAN